MDSYDTTYVTKEEIALNLFLLSIYSGYIECVELFKRHRKSIEFSYLVTPIA